MRVLWAGTPPLPSFSTLFELVRYSKELGKGLWGGGNMGQGTYHFGEHCRKGFLDSPLEACNVDDGAKAQQSILEERKGQ